MKSMPCSLQTLHRLNWYGIKFHTQTHKAMYTTLARIEKAVIKVLDKAAYVFLTAMSVIFALVAICTICTGLGIVNLFGCAGLAGASYVCWNMRR